MKIAIHHTPGSFSDRWIAYCKKQNIEFKIVNCYATDIISQLKDFDALMWHHNHENTKDVLFAKQLIYSLEQGGKKTFPDFKTCWHFDDKLGQKYLFEAVGAPFVPSYVFYTRLEAMQWIAKTTFPKVFKLRKGAGSANVNIVKTADCARALVNKAFGKGFSQFDNVGYFKDRLNKYRSGNDSLLGVIKGFGRLFINTEFAKLSHREKGYIYFQDFIPNNLYDIRVIVINGRAFAIKRMVRKGDFRASGSGSILYEKEHFSNDTINLAFQLTDKIQSQCAAYDFVYNEGGNPLVVELSYGFSIAGYDQCAGYWDKSLQFHEGAFIPQNWMVETLINK
jgi:glutathione synthase/RimK-type ligase-like ATP-grasp enzyme